MQRGGAEDDPRGARSRAPSRSPPRPQAAAQLHLAGERGGDLGDERRVRGLALARAVEVDDVQRSRRPSSAKRRAWRRPGPSLKTSTRSKSPCTSRTARPPCRSIAGIEGDHAGDRRGAATVAHPAAAAGASPARLDFSGWNWTPMTLPSLAPAQNGPPWSAVPADDARSVGSPA